MSAVKSNRIQIGQSATASENFAFMTPAVPDGTLEIRRGNADAPGALIAKINADGGINCNGAAFAASANAATALGTGTYTKVNLQVENFDTHNAFTNSRFVAPVAGYYHFAGSVVLGGSNVVMVAAIMVNGSPRCYGTYGLLYGSAVAGTVYLAAGDYVELAALSETAGKTTAVTTTTFSGHFVRGA